MFLDFHSTLDNPEPKTRAGKTDCYEIDEKGRSRLKYEPDGWSFWEWKGFQIHYVAKGSRGPPILFVHGRRDLRNLISSCSSFN